MDLEQHFLSNLQANELVRTGDRILLAVSGGIDSVALTHLFNHASKVLNIELGIAHIHHGMRPQEADGDAVFVKALAARLQMPFYHYDLLSDPQLIGTIDTDHNALRVGRYKALQQLAWQHAYQFIATAHHCDDQAETLVMRMLRGTGRRGLGAMQVKRDMMIRPLLAFRRHELKSYLEQGQHQWVEDSSNQQTHYLRNRIRQHVMPVLQDIEPRVHEHLYQLSMHMQEHNDWVHQHIQKLWQAMAMPDHNGSMFACDALLKLHPLERKELVFYTFEQLCGRRVGLDQKHINLIEAYLLENDAGALSLPAGIQLMKSCGYVYMTKKLVKAHFDMHVQGAGQWFLPHEATLTVSNLSQEGDNHWIIQWDGLLPVLPNLPHMPVIQHIEDAPFPWHIRNWQPGDRVCLPSSQHKKVQDVFTDLKVPRWLRHQFPVIVPQGRDPIVLGILNT